MKQPSRLLVSAIVGIFFILILWHVVARADPRYKAIGEGGEIVVLYDEPCKFPAVVGNLKYRATWAEKNKVFEGCWGLSVFRVVLLYMDDKTVSAIPMPMFEKVTGA